MLNYRFPTSGALYEWEFEDNYAPWGNLAFFYRGYRYSSGLIRLGRIDGDIAPLLMRGTFDLHIELLP
ncbi:MAG: hypothetical protein KJZ80_20385 [Hyphomicrobiaceae bacterium]|nr:hypothetical protein [Hyphomicrobiaceae bacterium]